MAKHFPRHLSMNDLENVESLLKYKKILITGGTGQLGSELKSSLKFLGKIWIPSRQEFDLSDPESLRDKIRENKPDLIINSAAYTSVEGAEINRELARTINTFAPKVIAEEANRIQIPLIHYSTDYVFDGSKKLPYTENDKPNPKNIYGKTKLDGELAIKSVHNQFLIIRTSGVYSIDRGNNFYRKMLKLFKEKEKIYVVNDQISSPTSTKYLAKKTTQIIKQLNNFLQKDDRWQIYHLTENKIMSWYEFALKIYKDHDEDDSISIKEILPIDSDKYPTLAKRPQYSVLDNSLIHKNFSLK